METETTAETESAAARDTTWGLSLIGGAVRQYRIWLILLLLMLIATIASSGNFIHLSNLINDLFIAAPLGIAAIGETLVILTGGIDLSVASVWILASVVAGTAANQGVSPLLALLFALLIGALAGAINGLVVIFLKVSPLIVTLGMLVMAEGAARIYTNNNPILSLPSDFQALGTTSVGPVPVQVIVWVAMVALMGGIIARSVLGKTIYAVGGNPTASRYFGLPVAASLVTVYCLSGVFAALAGTLQSAYLNIALPNADLTTLFDVIAGVVIGGASLFGGEGKLVNTMGGVLVVVVIENTLRIVGVSQLIFQAVVGLIIVGAVYLNVGLRGKAHDRVRQKGI
ncbi:MAG TPA: ABC transporter permease [Ktedonobacterales bacterium]|nr:ABC transporter permease [Ktedonobacterales bacterium]